VLCDAPNRRGGTWNREGVIVFNPDANGGLSHVSKFAVSEEPERSLHRCEGGPSQLPLALLSTAGRQRS